MDPEQAREELRTALRTFGANVTRFKDPDLDIIVKARYRSARALETASRRGLTGAGLPVALVDYIMALKGALFDPILSLEARCAYVRRSADSRGCCLLRHRAELGFKVAANCGVTHPLCYTFLRALMLAGVAELARARVFRAPWPPDH